MNYENIDIHTSFIAIVFWGCLADTPKEACLISDDTEYELYAAEEDVHKSFSKITLLSEPPPYISVGSSLKVLFKEEPLSIVVRDYLCSLATTVYPDAPQLSPKTKQTPTKTKTTAGWNDSAAIRKQCYERYRTAQPDTMIVKRLPSAIVKFAK